ncbi:MAG: HAD family hydrolase [Planctomycetes bacterium]|nr:HAD family hydrolase [Planctomycetota bacterium]
MRAIRAVIFDVGNTLVEGALPWYEFYSLAMKRTGRPMALVAVVKAYERAVRRMTADRVAVANNREARIPGLSSYLAEEFGLSQRQLDMALDEVLFDHPEARHLVLTIGAAETLIELRHRGYRLAAISNWSADLPRTMSLMGLKEHLEGIFASEALGYSKPHAASFLVPLDRMGLTPGESLYVGDLYDVDVAGAREVGLEAVLVDPLGLGLHPDVTTIACLSELLDLLPGVATGET